MAESSHNKAMAKAFAQFLRVLDSIAATLEYWFVIAEDILLFPVAYLALRKRSYHDLPPKLQFALMRFGMSKPYDPRIHGEILKKRRARINYDAMEFMTPPDERTMH
jgi:hypothetical protein